MNKQLARMYFVLISALGVVGLFVSGHLFQIMNVDIALDLTRILLAAILFYSAFMSQSNRAVNDSLNLVGILYIGLAVIGLFTPTVWGMLPAGLTGFDIVFHLVTGAVALWAGMMYHATNTLTAARS